MTVTVFGYLLLVLVWIEKIYQTLETVFDHISKHLEVRQKYSAMRCIFNSLLAIWECGQRRSIVFEILCVISFRLIDRIGKVYLSFTFLGFLVTR